MEAQAQKESVFADFRMEYQSAVNDIEHVKSRQWAITYYLLLLLAAIIGFSKAMDLSQQGLFYWGKWVLSVIAILIAYIGGWFLLKFQGALGRYRTHLTNDIVPNLSKEFQEYYEEVMKKRYNGDPTWKEKHLSGKEKETKIHTLVFSLMLWVSAFFVIWCLFLMPDP